MEINEFDNSLKELNLSKKDFAILSGLTYNSVVNWNQKGKTADWVDSWILNYKKAVKFDKLKKMLVDEF